VILTYSHIRTLLAIMTSTVQFLRSPVTRGVIPSLGLAKPQILWIGCSSSGIAETETLGVLPEEILEHRNIANLLSNDDLSTQSSVEYALRVLKVWSDEHSIVSHLLTSCRSSTLSSVVTMAANSPKSIRTIIWNHRGYGWSCVAQERSVPETN
jgi:hypothetical protein